MAPPKKPHISKTARCGAPLTYTLGRRYLGHPPSIINAVGSQATCGNGEKYWNDTVIFIVWDDWGGWWDHVNPQDAQLPVRLGDPLCDVWGCGNTYGFRVPFLVVSAYMAPGIDRNPPFQGYVSGDTRTPGGGMQAPYIHDFGSILRFIEKNFSLAFINSAYEFADFYAPELKVGAIPLADFFCDNSCTAQPFLSIPVPAGSWQAADFTTDTDTSDPDNDVIDND